MSALSKLRDFSADAIESAVAPLVSSLEAKRRSDEEAACAENRAALKKHVGDLKAIQRAEATLAKAVADEARAAADLAKAKAERLDAEIAVVAVRDPWTRERDRLARGAYAAHHKAEALRLVNAAIDALTENRQPGLEAPLRSLLRLRVTVTAICSGDELPPADDLIAWVQGKLEKNQRDVEAAVVAYANGRAEAARLQALNRIITA